MNSSTSSIEEQIEVLTKARQACRLCMKTDPGAIRNGSESDYDSPVVSHWSQWLGDLQPLLLIVGQDFANFASFEKFRGHPNHSNPTNQNLYRFLREAGFCPKPPSEKDVTSRVFLTNSFLCLKTSNGMNGAARRDWSRNCTEHHLQPLMRVLAPKAMVALGGPAWESIRERFSLASAPAHISEAAGGHWAAKDAEIFAMGHCGSLGLRNRGEDLQRGDWQRLGDFLKFQIASSS